MEAFNLTKINISIWTLLMFIVIFVMAVILITHIIVYRDKQKNLEYKLENRMTAKK